MERWKWMEVEMKFVTSKILGEKRSWLERGGAIGVTGEPWDASRVGCAQSQGSDKVCQWRERSEKFEREQRT